MTSGENTESGQEVFRMERKIMVLVRKFQSGWSLPEEKKGVLDRIVELCTPLVERTVAGYLKKYPQLDRRDLIQEARLAVVKAVEKFDPGKGNRFSVYARCWMRAFLERYVARNRLIISAPVNLVHVYSNRNRSGCRRELVRKYRIAERYLERLREYERIRVYSLTTDNPDILRKALNIPAPECYSPEDMLSRKEMQETISAVCARFAMKLNERERHVFYACIYTDSPLSMRDAGSMLGISAERVRQIRKRLEEKFRNFFYQSVPDAECYRMFL